ncbi:LysR family transcriptional regulator [Nonomuraea sp. NBC_01738]|uniref:LysR family transcriptional regulator n=1 Tax=Nonomuraea sp. NBC_01738 TaxID=2976003 RepID=UPI002E0E2E8F|nr:LysR family transcriptional regulator [Nonomuraea sp. NBC_01738]
MDLEVRHLRVLCAIADTGSISRAAASLGMSQPAMAAQLRRIERQFGGPLFERGREGATPTPLGRWLLLRSRALLPAFDELERDARRHTRAEPASIRVGCAPTRLAIYVAKTLRRLLPGADISLRTEETMDVLPGLLASQRIELATLDDYPGHELVPPAGVVYEVVAVEPIFVGLAEDHPLAAADEVELGDLAHEDWAQPAVLESGARDHFLGACTGHGFEPRVAYGVNLEIALDLISEGRCVGLFQAAAPARERVAVRPLRGSPLRFRHVLGWTEQGPFAGQAHDLVQAVTKTYWSEAVRAPAYSSWIKRHGAFKAYIA